MYTYWIPKLTASVAIENPWMRMRISPGSTWSATLSSLCRQRLRTKLPSAVRFILRAVQQSVSNLLQALGCRPQESRTRGAWAGAWGGLGVKKKSNHGYSPVPAMIPPHFPLVLFLCGKQILKQGKNVAFASWASRTLFGGSSFSGDMARKSHFNATHWNTAST